MKIFLAAINSSYQHSCPAIFALKKSLHKERHQLSWGQWTINTPFKEVLSHIYSFDPQIITFSVYIWNVEYLARLLPFIKGALPGALISLGGPQASGEGVTLLKRLPEADCLYLGEGEKFFPYFVESLGEGMVRPNFPGLIWQGGEAFESAPKLDLGEIPFLYDEADLMALKEHIIYYESSRGCPHSCIFCASADETLRQRPGEMVKKELDVLARLHGGQIKFVDRTFNADLQRAKGIVSHLLTLYKPGLSWHLEISPANLDAELLELFSKAPPGYFRLEAGVQSLHPPSLRAIRRLNDWPKIKKNLTKLLEKDNLHLHLDLIAGLPKETWRSFEEGFNKLHELAPHYLQLGFLKILPGSILANEAVRWDLAHSLYPPYEIISTPDLQGGELILLGQAEALLDSLYNCGRFRQTLYQAGLIWPRGALDMYLSLSKMKKDRGALSVGKKLALLWEFCALFEKDQQAFLKTVLIFDWYLYGLGEPFPLDIEKSIAMPLKLDFCPIRKSGGILAWDKVPVKVVFEGKKGSSATGGRKFDIFAL